MGVSSLNESGTVNLNLAGRIIKNRYRLDEQTGETGVYTTFRAFDMLESTPVTIKLLRPGPGDLVEVSNPFLAAARRNARADHPALVKVCDFGMEEQTAFVVEEPVEAAGLETRLSEGNRMNMKGFLNFAYQLTEAVDQIHQAGSVHGNIVAGNVYILPGARIKLADAGYPFVNRATNRIILPVPRDAGREEDLRGLGFLFYHCVTGKTLDPALLPEDSPTPRLDLGEEVPPKVVQILEKSLSRGDKSRFASASEMLREIGVALQRQDPMAVLPTAIPVEEEAPPPQSFLRRLSKVQLAVGAAAIILLVVLLVVVIANSLIPGDKTNTPNLVGRNIEEAFKEAENLGLKLVVGREEHRADIKADRVVSQVPEAGKRVPQGEIITVVVSLGPLQVPNLSGLSLNDAAALLKSRSLEVGEVFYETSTEYRPGIVIESDPPYGAGVSGGEKVDLVVSKAP